MRFVGTGRTVMRGNRALVLPAASEGPDLPHLSWRLV